MDMRTQNIIAGSVAACIVVVIFVFLVPGLLDGFDIGQSHAETAAEDVKWCTPYAPRHIDIIVPRSEDGRKTYYDTFVARGWSNIVVYDDRWNDWRMSGECLQAGERKW